MSGKDVPTLLGFVGRSLPEEEQGDLSLSRVGGHPSWPAPAPPSEGQPTCRRCEQPLAFLAQLHAGYEAAPWRSLHVFTCLTPACGADERGWCVYRSMGHPPEQKVVASARKKSITFAASCKDAQDDCGLGGASAGDWGAPASSAADDWGAPPTSGDDWGAPATSAEDDWGVSNSGGAAAADAELDALLQARDATGSAIADAAAATTKAVAKASAVSAISEASAAGEECTDWQGILDSSMKGTLPAFALEIFEEPAKVAKYGEHEKQLLERYQAADDAGEEEAGTACAEAATEPWPEDEPVASSTSKESKRGKSSKKGSSSSSGPVGEARADEDEEVFGDSWFMKFQRRLARSPSQVVRYAWGGKPMWISAPPEETSNKAWPPPCSRCGSPRSFELQLLPTLLCEMRRWCPDHMGDWDIEWGTVMVYTCRKDCAGSEPVREFIVAQPAI